MRLASIALAALLSFALVACGDDDDGGNGATATSGATSTATVSSGTTPPSGTATAPGTTPGTTATVALSPTFACTGSVDFFAARAFVGETATVQGPVMGTTVRGDSVVLFVGAAAEATLRLEVVIPSAGRATFAAPPETAFADREVCVKGTVELVDNITTIEASSPDELSVVE
ncbi:MAG: hypothetical protein IH609_15550 [Dehalococcoidia bacterium]|nr:hypothetical protein [Dehalococcoidia bacterium]